MPADQTGAVGSCGGMAGQERTSMTVEEEGSALTKKYLPQLDDFSQL